MDRFLNAIANIFRIPDLRRRLLFTLGQANSPTGPGNFDGGGLFSVGRDGKDLRALFKTVKETRAQNQYVYRTMVFVRRIPGNDEEIIARGNLTEKRNPAGV